MYYRKTIPTRVFRGHWKQYYMVIGRYSCFYIPFWFFSFKYSRILLLQTRVYDRRLPNIHDIIIGFFCNIKLS